MFTHLYSAAVYTKIVIYRKKANCLTIVVAIEPVATGSVTVLPKLSHVFVLASFTPRVFR